MAGKISNRLLIMLLIILVILVAVFACLVMISSRNPENYTANSKPTLEEMQEKLDTLSVGERREIFLQNIFGKENYINMIKSNKLDSLPWSNINASGVVVYNQLEMCLAAISIIDLNPYVLLDEDDPNIWMEYDNGDRVNRKAIPCEFSDFTFYRDAITGYYIVKGLVNGEKFEKEYSLE